MIHRFVPGFSFAAALCAVAALSAPPEKADPKAAHLSPLLPRPEVLHALFAAQQQLVADYYWVRSAEALGSAHDADTYRDVYFFVKQVVDLDPNFAYAYVFGGTGVTYNLGRERWVNTEESTELLKRGMQRFPRNVMIRVLLGFNLSYYHHRFREAADLLSETAKMPGAPAYLGPLATRLYAREGDLDTGIAFAESLATSTSDPHTKATMERRAKELELEKLLQRIDEAASEFAESVGRKPISIAELEAHGYALGDVTDPLGGEITFDENGRAVSTQSSDRMAHVYGVDEEPAR